MNARAAESFHPPWARPMWYDSQSIYLEMPVVNSHPIIMQFDWTDGGLNKALKTMRSIAEEHPDYRGTNNWSRDHDVIKRFSRAKPTPKITERSREIARAVLKRMLGK